MAHLLAEKLITRFQATHTKPPEWAWKYAPSIPLIGHRYKPGSGLLIYASAENLTWMNGTQVPLYFDEPNVRNRYRVQCDACVRDSHDSFFPDIGIQPANDGGLFAAALFVLQQLGLPTADDPRELLEDIAITNWCKFTIESDTNEDYAGDIKKLAESLPLVVAELNALQPAVVVVPKQIWRKRKVAQAMTEAAPKARFLPVAQFNATVVNCHLGAYKTQSDQLCTASQGTPLACWMDNLKNMNVRNAWRYIAFLDERLNDWHGRIQAVQF